MPLEIDLQLVMSDKAIPDVEKIQHWADAAADACRCDNNMVLTIRVTDALESAELNDRYRNQPGPTNVLSFPFEDPPGQKTNVLGDLVVCAPVVQKEADEQHKSSDAHWAHILVHGVLHLCGYDHIDQSGADEMESLETGIITGLGFPPPYEEQKL
ncbi:MAG: rRNA maturation RNase YbeY [Arenicellales bacterium]